MDQNDNLASFDVPFHDLAYVLIKGLDEILSVDLQRVLGFLLLSVKIIDYLYANSF